MKRLGLILLLIFLMFNLASSYDGYPGYQKSYQGYLNREEKAAIVKAAVDSVFAIQERKIEAERLQLAKLEKQRQETLERQCQNEKTTYLIEQETPSNFSYQRYYAWSSFYASGNRQTANGEIFNPMALAAAHKTLPFGTLLRVTNRYNGRAVIVRINDRGPFIRGREIDLTYGAAREISAVNAGVFPVTIEILSLPAPFRNYWPTPGYYGISSKFRAWRGWRSHQGVDIHVPSGVPVHPTGNGIIAYSGWWGGYGLVVVINHYDGRQTRYAHLSRAFGKHGQMVTPQNIIGYTGKTGKATGPNLHYEKRINGIAVNPLVR